MTVPDDRISAWLHGGLDEAEAARIAALVVTDPEVDKRAGELRRLDDLVRQAVPLDETLPDELMARLGLGTNSAPAAEVIDLAAVRAERSRVAPPRRFAAFATGGWRVAAQVLIVAGLGLGAYAMVQVPGPRAPDAPYRALGDAPTVQGQANALVMFTAGTNAAAVKAIADRSGARVIGAPSETGAWRFAFDPARRDAALAQLRGLPEVTMAEPIEGEAP